MLYMLSWKPVLTAPVKFYHHQLFFFVSRFEGPELAQLGLVTTNHHCSCLILLSFLGSSS